MKLPWHGKSGLAKATAFLATLLVVSIGLCGANFVAVMGVGNWGSTLAPRNLAGPILIVAGIVELVGVVVGIVGLIVVAVIAIVRALAGRSDTPSENEKSE
jgi:hypothetical protein